MLNYNTFNFKSAVVVFIAGYIFATMYLVLCGLSNKFSSSEAARMYLSSGHVIETSSKIINDKSSSAVSDSSLSSWDYPFTPQQNYELSPKEEIDVTLVTYIYIKDQDYFRQYIQRWFGAINVVAYYYESEAEYIDSFTQICDSKSRVHCIFTQVSDPVPINKLKNIGIDAVITTHFIFVESNLVPTTNLYDDLMRTPGYLWREPSFVGIIPVYEWSSDNYDIAKKSFKSAKDIPNGPSSLKNCLSSYECRPLQTSTIPLQFRWFSFINYRAMNCIEKETEVYMVLKKTNSLPHYDESIVQRGYDNIEYVEKIRNSNMKIAQLCTNFLFRVSGIGVDSRTVLENMKNEELRNQFLHVREEFLKTIPNHHPIVECREIEPAMRGWVSYQPYTWMEEEERDGVFYPKIAVQSNKKIVLDV